MPQVCLKCGARVHHGGQDTCLNCGSLITHDNSISKPAGRSVAVIDRYHDGYITASSAVDFATVIKALAVVLAILVAASALWSDDGAGMFLILCVAASLALTGWISGVMVSAQGQALRAALDTAVSTSPFLTNAERAEAMGLPIDIGQERA
jgi:hypothetical protein